MIFPLFETLCYEQGKVCHLDFHSERYQRSLFAYYGKRVHATKFEEIFAEFAGVNILDSHGLYRLRVCYNQKRVAWQILPYQRRTFRQFKLIHCDHLQYELKFCDRRIFQPLLAQKGDADEIMIIKNGWVTDCSIGNLIFRSGNTWFTPDTPLLAGTQRAFLLAIHQIQACPIRAEEVSQFDEIRLINALNPFFEKETQE